LDRVAEEINEMLQETSHVSIGELSSRFGLYSEFLADMIERRLGKSIRGQLADGVSFLR
jgi:hypothetical protein